jgi:galacturan 1,4-alpha-galacturonidase
MYLNRLIFIALLLASLATCLTPSIEFNARNQLDGPRPKPFPYHPGKSYKPSPPCTKSCTVARPKAATIVKNVKVPYDSGKDVLQAVQSCNPGGKVIFEKNETYMIGTALDLSNLKNVDLDIQGTIKVSFHNLHVYPS